MKTRRRRAVIYGNNRSAAETKLIGSIVLVEPCRQLLEFIYFGSEERFVEIARNGAN